MPITVRKVWQSHPHSIELPSDGSRVAIDEAWRVHGIEDDRFVVTCKWGMTIVDYFGRMQTSWHIGISAGDLARLKLPEAS